MCVHVCMQCVSVHVCAHVYVCLRENLCVHTHTSLSVLCVRLTGQGLASKELSHAVWSVSGPWSQRRQ